MKLALVAPLPPTPSPWSDVVASLLPHLADGGVEVFVEHPYRVRPDAALLAPVRTRDQLAAALREDPDALPVHFVGDSIHHLDQLRFIASFPGIAVLDGVALDRLARGLFVQLDGLPERALFDGFDGLGPGDGPGLARAIARASRAVVLTRDADREALGDLAGPPVAVIPQLRTSVLEDGGREASAAAEALLGSGRGVSEPLGAAAPGPQPSVQAVIVSYNSKDLISPCLQSLLDQDYGNLEITVVDNASADGTAEFVRARFPDVKVVESRRNLGFAAGCNLGFRQSRSRYVVLLNQDALARRNWITELVRVAELDPRVAGVGSKLLMDRCPTILNSTGIEINEAGWAWDRQVGERDEDPSPLPQEVFGICGGALLYRRESIEAVGGFDDRYFMYFEDTDLCWRLRLHGHKILYAPLAVVRHDFHGDSGATPGRLLRRRYMSERNRLQTLVKNAEWSSLKAVLPRVLAYDRGRYKAYRARARAGDAPDFHRELARIVRRSWVWNLLRLPGLWWRRRRVQRAATTAGREDVRRFILPGMNEGGHQGDVDSFHDRFSARRRTAIVMGSEDDGSLGSGWHALEHPPGAVQPYRWCKGRAWFYLEHRPEHRRVVLKLASPIAPNTLTVFWEDRRLGDARVDGHVKDAAFDLPAGPAHPAVAEFRCECDTIRPADNNPGGDIRQLGLILFEMRLE